MLSSIDAQFCDITSTAAPTNNNTTVSWTESDDSLPVTSGKQAETNAGKSLNGKMELCDNCGNLVNEPEDCCRNCGHLLQRNLEPDTPR